MSCGLSAFFIHMDVFVKWRKINISFPMSVCVSVRMEQLDSHWMDFDEIWYLSAFRNAVQQIQFALKSEKFKAYFT